MLISGRGGGGVRLGWVRRKYQIALAGSKSKIRIEAMVILEEKVMVDNF